MSLTGRQSFRIRLSIVVAVVAGIAGAASAQTMADRMKELERYYGDFKKPQKLGGDNPHKRTVTICAGYPLVIKDAINGVAHIERDPNSPLTATSHGTDGSIDIKNAKETEDGPFLLKYQVGGQAKELYVLVVDCDGKATGKKKLPRSPRTITHRRAKCTACADAANKLNAAADRHNRAQRANAPTAQLIQSYEEVLALAQELDACEKKCAGTSMRTKAMIGAGAAAGTAFAFAGGGNPPAAPPQAPITATNPPAPTGQSPPAAPTPNPQPSPAPAPNPQPGPAPAPGPTQPDVTGSYNVRLAVTSDPGRHDPNTLYSSVTRVDVQVDGPSVRITGPFPWVTVMGTYSPSTGGFTADGNGTVAGIANVPVSVTGTFSGPSLTFGQIQVGPTNLPGNVAELLNGTGAKQ